MIIFMRRLVFIALLISNLMLLFGCGTSQTQPPPAPPPPTSPVSPGYIQSYDHKLGFGFEYPEAWEMEVIPIGNPGGGTSADKVEIYTKKGEETRIEISVKPTNFNSLAEIKAFGYIDQQSILKETFVEINDRQAYEVVFRQYPANKARWVMFLANGKEYKVAIYTTEELYPANEETFNHVIASFVIS